MKKKEPWSRNDKLVVGALSIALVACISAFFIPEVRRAIGLDKPGAVQAPPAQTSAAPSAASPSQAAPSTPAPMPPKSQTTQHTKTARAVTARTSGPNSPAVGSIQQGPGSALSIGQQGGITAGTVNIGTLPPKPLVLTDTQSALVRSDLAQYSGIAMDVVLVNRTEVTTDFGNRLVSALKGAGWNVNYSSAAMLIRSNGAQSPPGLSLDIGAGSEKVANELILSLMRHGVVDSKPIPALQVPTPNKLALYICEPR